MKGALRGAVEGVVERGAVEAGEAAGEPRRDVIDTRALARSYAKLGVVVVLLGVCSLLVQRFSDAGGTGPLGALRSLDAASPFSAPLLFVATSAALIAAGAPRLAFCTVGGMLFGFAKGLALIQVATLIGAWTTFGISRWTARDWAGPRLARLERLRSQMREPSVLDIFLVRQLPITGAVISLFLGTTRVRPMPFLLGSFLGFLPAAVVFTLLGSGFIEESAATSLARVWGAVPLLIAAGWLSVWLAARFNRRRVSAHRS